MAPVVAAVRDALDRYVLIPSDSGAVIDTNGHSVVLTGHVRTSAEHDAVLDAVWMMLAVYGVFDKLVVTCRRAARQIY